MKELHSLKQLKRLTLLPGSGVLLQRFHQSELLEQISEFENVACCQK